MKAEAKRIAVIFYRTLMGAEPVRDWLKELAIEDRRIIGFDIADVEYGWPVGMPLCRSLGDGLWEVRSVIAHPPSFRTGLSGWPGI